MEFFQRPLSERQTAAAVRLDSLPNNRPATAGTTFSPNRLNGASSNSSAGQMESRVGPGSTSEPVPSCLHHFAECLHNVRTGGCLLPALNRMAGTSLHLQCACRGR